MSRVLVFFLLAALTIGGCESAWADVFDFSYSEDFSSVSASGTFDATLQSGNTYLINSITGTRFDGANNFGMTLLTPGAWQGNDNLLYYPAGGDNPNGSGYLNYNGFSFSANATDYNVYYYTALGDEYYENGAVITTGSMTVSPHAAPGPIPGTGALSYLIVLLGGLVRWRETVVASVRVLALRMREWAFALSRRSGSAMSALPPAP